MKLLCIGANSNFKSEMSEAPYTEAIRILMNLVITTRLDLTVAVNRVNTYLYRLPHCNTVKRIENNLKHIKL